jgi:3'-phosphoadenosine 5'-phosphosulfate sulfotransferase (PAPS reductase)/FAD synthetase
VSKALAVVSMSGGKDSMATWLIAAERMGRDNCRAAIVDTGNEHELTIQYWTEYLPTICGPIVILKANFDRQIAGKRAYVAKVWREEGVPEAIVERALSALHPTGNPFLDLCVWKGRFPSRKAQFCTQELKRRPLDNYMLDLIGHGYEVSSWRGIRRDESQNRANALEHDVAAEGWKIEHPIVDWTAQQVIDFIQSRGVKLNPLYSLGMGRVGCMPCINCSKNELLEISKRFPLHIDRIREWESLVCMAAKRGWTTFFTDRAEDGESAPEIFSRLNIDARVRWAQTARGGRQQDFVRQQAPEACSSVYGLCE